MKSILFTLGLSIMLLSFTNELQSDADQIVQALKKADTEQIVKYFDSFIDIKLPEKDEVKNIGKNQAGIIFNSFYENNKITGFELSSQREMSGTMYIAGKLTSDSKGYNLTMLLKVKEGKSQIITIRIN